MEEKQFRVRQRKAPEVSGPALPDTAPKTWPNGSAVYKRSAKEAPRKPFRPDELQPGFTGRIVSEAQKHRVFQWLGGDKGYKDIGLFDSLPEALIKLSDANRVGA